MSQEFLRLVEPISPHLAKVHQSIDEECQCVNSRLLAELLHWTFQVRGKMLRPVISLSTALLGNPGMKMEQILNVATGLEILHTASLVHDDIIDSGMIRRGQETVNSKWGIGEATLLGDWLLAKSFELMTRTQNEKVIHGMTLLTSELTEGQFLENELNRNGEYGLKEYLVMIDLKTSSMFRWAAAFSSYIVDDLNSYENVLKEFGTQFGLLFQMVDDLIDLLLEDHQALKTTGVDLQNGLKTLPVLIALNEAAPVSSPVEEALKAGDPSIAPGGLKQYLYDCKALEKSFQMILETRDKCLELLEPYPDETGKKILKDLCQLTLDQVSPDSLHLSK